jgi:hypothetical protein
LPLTTTLLCGVRTFLGGIREDADAAAQPTRPSRRNPTCRPPGRRTPAKIDGVESVGVEGVEPAGVEGVEPAGVEGVELAKIDRAESAAIDRVEQAKIAGDGQDEFEGAERSGFEGDETAGFEMVRRCPAGIMPAGPGLVVGSAAP